MSGGGGDLGWLSTYAPTISTIEQREYAVKRKGARAPTYIGMAVIHLLRRASTATST